MAKILTNDLLHRRLHYDEQTGVFTHLVGTAKAEIGTRAGGLDRHGYRIVWVCGRRYRAARLAWMYMHGVWPTPEVDHINRIRDDDRICNLREASRKLNLFNQDRPLGVSKHRYVYFDGHRKQWMAYYKDKAKKSHYIGRFDTIDRAIEAAEMANVRLRGFNMPGDAER